MRSCRRIFLDYYLDKYSHLIKGNVFDIGGDKFNKRGNFNLNNLKVKCTYINNNLETKPDILSDITKINLKANVADTVIVTETLEYVKDIKLAMSEMSRISKKNSFLLISIPLINSIHGDKDQDMVRYTESYLYNIINKYNFKILNFHRMGGLGSVIFDLIRFHLVLRKRKILLRFLYIFYYFFLFIDKLTKLSREYINTGYFVVIQNNE